jgi:ABC-type glycerol-3-phosphate transport system permease component
MQSADSICVYAVLNVSMAFWLLTPFIQELSREREEAVALDGAAR